MVRLNKGGGQFIEERPFLKGHGNEPIFSIFLHKSVRHRFLTKSVEPCPILAPELSEIFVIENRLLAYQRYGETPAPRIGESGSWLLIKIIQILLLFLLAACLALAFFFAVARFIYSRKRWRARGAKFL
jgi:hypothetical protein